MEWKTPFKNNQRRHEDCGRGKGSFFPTNLDKKTGTNLRRKPKMCRPFRNLALQETELNALHPGQGQFATKEFSKPGAELRRLEAGALNIHSSSQFQLS